MASNDLTVQDVQKSAQEIIAKLVSERDAAIKAIVAEAQMRGKAEARVTELEAGLFRIKTICNEQGRGADSRDRIDKLADALLSPAKEESDGS